VGRTMRTGTLCSFETRARYFTDHIAGGGTNIEEGKESLLNSQKTLGSGRTVKKVFNRHYELNHGVLKAPLVPGKKRGEKEALLCHIRSKITENMGCVFCKRHPPGILLDQVIKK